MLNRLKALAGKVLTNEVYTLLLITVGVPYVTYIWFGAKAAVTVFVLTQITLGIIRERE
jgi:hypothetical protein